MLAFIRKLLPKKKGIQNFSTTMTSAMDGVQSKKDLSPEITALLKGLKKKENISNEDLNKIVNFYFNQPVILPGLYGIHKSILDQMCFEINGVNPVFNKSGDIENVYLNLREVTFNNELVITVSVKDFHETFNHLNFQPVESKS